MKYSLLSLVFTVILSSYSLISFAQKPEKGTLGATAGMSAIAGNPTTDASTTGTLLLKYYLSEEWVLRGAVNYRSLNGVGTVKRDSTVFGVPGVSGFPTSGDGATRRETEISGGAYNAEIGIQRNLGDIEKTEIYVGSLFVIGIDGNRKTYERTDWLIDQGTRLKGDYDEFTAITPIRTRYGLRFVVGANYFITQNFSLGAEFGYAFTSFIEEGGTVSRKSLINGQADELSYSADGFSETRNTFHTTGAVLTLSFFF
jgi:hypothetical protein